MRWCLALGLLALVVHHAPAQPIPSNFHWPPTFREDAKATCARVIVSGTIANPRLVGEKGFTDFSIETVLRDDPAMKGRSSLVLNCYLPVEKKNYPPRYVLFCDVEKGKVEPFRGVRVQRVASVAYVKKAIALDSTDPVRNILFFFRHLDDPDPAVANDAFYEISLAEDADIGAAGRKMDVKKIRKRLEDPKIPSSHLGVYAKLLAAAGTAKDATTLAAILNDPLREAEAGLDSILVAYVMLSPKDGWAYTLRILGNPAEEFLRRYRALRAVKSILASRTGVVTNREITAAYRLLLAQEDILDIAIEDLREWQRWDLADAVLAIAKTKAHESPVARRSLLRYALQCEGNAAAKDYVAARRKADAETVADSEADLESEAAEAKKSAETPKKRRSR